jgi:hypothetical protein
MISGYGSRSIKAIAALLLFGFCTEIFALQIFHQSIENIISAAEAIIVVEVKNVAVDRSTDSIDVRIGAVPIEIIKGKSSVGKSLLCVYRQPYPQFREEPDGTTLVDSPLVTGSGMEFDVKEQQQVILFLSSAPDKSGSCNLLRVEPLSEKESIVKQLSSKR